MFNLWSLSYIVKNVLRKYYILILDLNFRKIYMKIWIFWWIFLIQYSLKTFWYKEVSILYSYNIGIFLSYEKTILSIISWIYFYFNPLLLIVIDHYLLSSTTTHHHWLPSTIVDHYLIIIYYYWLLQLHPLLSTIFHQQLMLLTIIHYC